MTTTAFGQEVRRRACLDFPAGTRYDKESVLRTIAGRWADFYGQYTPLKVGGHEARGACRLHGGRRGDSFAVDLSTGMWFCHADCAQGGDVFDFLMRVEGLDFPQALEALAEFAGVSPTEGAAHTGTAGPPKKATVKRRIVATYDYTDESGALLFQALRYEPKGFSQRRPADGGAWVYSLDGVRRVLYRLPEVQAAVAAGRIIHLVEGEKDADALHALGLCATCNPMGAGKWDDTFSEVLAGAAVVILPDNDAPGRRHADQVARSLWGRAKRIRVVELPDLPEKGDVSDWLAAGGTL